MKLKKQIGIFLLFLAQIILLVSGDSVLPAIEKTTCQPEDFQPSCNLSCTITTSQHVSYLQRWFTYSIKENEAGVRIYETNLDIEILGNGSVSYSISLPLSQYSAGFYICHFRYYLEDLYIDNATARFKIAKGTGKYINGSCSDASQCLTLNANCEDVYGTGQEICTCSGQYNIPDSQSNTVACLDHKEVDEPCNVDDECKVPGQNYRCELIDRYTQWALCECDGLVSYVEKDNSSMCLIQAKLGYACDYDEQCNDPYAECADDGKCNCLSNYYASRPFTQCFKSPVILNRKSCTPQDFDTGKNCTLSVTFDTPDDDYVFQDFQWQYWSSSSQSSPTIIFDGKFDNVNNASLQLSTYYYGFYTCQLYFKYIPTGKWYALSEIFNISTSAGAGLYENCSNNCITLNAQCVYNDFYKNKVCECVGTYSIQTAYACFQYVKSGDPCNINEQCNAPDEYYACTDNVCTCQQSYVYVNATGRNMCIAPVKTDGDCVYNEQCLLYTNNSVCDEGKCHCIDGYMNYYDHNCAPDDNNDDVDDDDGSSMNSWDKAAISLLTIAVVCLIIWWIYYIRQYCKKRC